MDTSIPVAPAALARRQNVRFGFELMGMCAVMCLGGELFSLATFVGLGWSTLMTTAPVLAAAVVTLNLIVPMTIYMAVRRHAWRHTVTMNATTAGIGVLAMIGIAAGLLTTAIVPTWHALFGIVCAPACVVMFVQMFRDRDMYTGGMAHEQHALTH